MSDQRRPPVVVPVTGTLCWVTVGFAIRGVLCKEEEVDGEALEVEDDDEESSDDEDDTMDLSLWFWTVNVWELNVG